MTRIDTSAAIDPLRRGAQELDVSRRGGVAGCEQVAGVEKGVLTRLVDEALEGPAVTVEHGEHASVSPAAPLHASWSRIATSP